MHLILESFNPSLKGLKHIHSQLIVSKANTRHTRAWREWPNVQELGINVEISLPIEQETNGLNFSIGL
jgi:hypothetical protein